MEPASQRPELPEIDMRIRRFVVATAASVVSIYASPGFWFAYEWFMPS